MPAQLTVRFIGPVFSIIFVKLFNIKSSFVISIFRYWQLEPNASCFFFPNSSWISMIVTVPPCSIILSAVAPPKPLAPPVITALQLL